MPRDFYDQDIAKLRSIIIADPGIMEDRLAIKLQYSTKSSRFQNIILELIKHGEIERVKQRHGRVREPQHIYPTIALLEAQQQRLEEELASLQARTTAAQAELETVKTRLTTTQAGESPHEAVA